MKILSRRAFSARTAHPRLVVIILLLGVAAILVSAVSLRESGIGWDSKFDTDAALAARGVSSKGTLATAYDTVPLTSEFYGTFIYQVADVLHTMRGGSTVAGSTQPLGADDPATYRYQGLVNLALALIAVTALAVALGIALRSLLAGAFFWSLTLSTPLWLGMSHVDFKDMPVAAGITLITAGLILSLSLRQRPKAITAGVLLGGAGGALALSSRAGSLALILALVGGTALVAIVRAQMERRLTDAVPVLLAGASAAGCALIFTWASNPIARIDMLHWLWDAFQTNRFFPWIGTVRTAGTDVWSTEIPLWYVPAWLVAQLPVLTLVSLVTALVLLLVTLYRHRRLVRSDASISLTPIVLQGLVLPGLIVLSGAVLYDGIRHLLFMIPALMAVPAIAVAVVERRPPTWLAFSAFVPVACVVVIGVSLFASIRWSPYSYAFVNPVAGLAKGAWELDYWGVSGREGVTRLNRLGFDRTRVWPAAEAGVPWGAEPVNETIESDQATGLYLFVRERERAADLGCEVLFEIRRDGQLLGEGASCPPRR